MRAATQASTFLKSHRGDAALDLRRGVATATSAGVLTVLQAWLLAQLVDRAIFHAAGLAQLVPWLGGMLVVLLLRSLLVRLAEHFTFRAAAGVRQRLREQLFDHLLALGPLHLRRHSSGDLVSRLTDGVEALEGYYARFLPAMSLAALIPLAILVFVIPLDWRSALVMLLTAPLIPLFMILIGRGAERLNQRQWREMTRMGGHFLDMLQGLTTLKLFNASRREAEVIAQVSDDYRQATMRVLRVAFLSSLALEFFATISIALVAVLIGFRLLFGEQDFFSGFFVLLLAPEFYLPLRSLGTHYHSRMAAMGAVEGMLELLSLPQPIGRFDALSATGRPPVGLFPLSLTDLHYRYPDGRQALRGVDLVLGAGERLALVGPSGAGKSTLVALLLGFMTADRGEIRVNDRALTFIDPQAWRRRLAWVPQRPYLFTGTLRDNLTLGLEGVDEVRIMQALQQAQADGFVRELPLGLETPVGEGGRRLSGGQVQRLALARVFLRDADLVILDEPTANLDLHNERLVQAAIDNLAQGRTVLSLAHRLSTVRKADRILVMERGYIVEQGSHRGLCRGGGLYRDMIAAQALQDA